MTSPQTSPRKVLIVGGAGYIGLPLSAALLDAGYAVRVVDAFLYGTEAETENLKARPGFEAVRADLRTADCSAWLDGVTDVVLLAAMVGDPISKRYPVQTRQINLDGATRLFTALKNKPVRVVFVSTCSNYGIQTDGKLATEESELRPLSLYAETKVEVEKLLLSGSWGFDFTILRFATAFGLSQRMRFDLTVNEFTLSLFRGEELLVYDADTWRPYCHIRDFGRAIRAVLEAPQEAVSRQVFNTGDDTNNHTKASILRIIEKQVPNPRVKYADQGKDRRNYKVDFSKIRERIGFTASTDVEQGVAELIAALKGGAFADVNDRPNFYGNRTVPLFDAEAATG